MKTIAISAAAAIAAALAVAGGVQAASTLSASGPVASGTLNCTLATNVGLVLGSVRRVDCEFERFDRRGRAVRESYVGLMKRAGLDLGIAGPQTISFRVTTNGARTGAGMLNGSFGGASAEASLVVGPGTHALFGETGDRIRLEPISQSEQIGMRLGLGPTAMELTSISNEAYSSLR